MEAYTNVDEAGWVIERLQERISFSGWFLALVCGMWLWALMLRLVF